jgi:hypothetical protein
MMVPVHTSNWPRTLLTMCRIVNDSSECVGSIFHVNGAATGFSDLADGGGPLCANAGAGASRAGTRTA